MEATQETTLNDLPSELLVKIFCDFVNTSGHRKFLKNVAPVCKSFKELSSVATLWKDVNACGLKMQDLINIASKGLLTYTRSFRLDDGPYQHEPDTYELSGLFHHCANLRKLSLHNMNLSTASLKDLPMRCPRLVSLTLENIRLHNGVRRLYLWPTGILDPVLNICGRNLKRLNISGYYSDIHYWVPNNNTYTNIISKISKCCPLLEELVFSIFNHYYICYKFSLDELQAGCRRLRVLEVSDCKIKLLNVEDYRGFPELESFEANNCDFRGQKLQRLLVYSDRLKKIAINKCRNIEMSDISMIPSAALEVLAIGKMLVGNLEFLSEALDKWKHTLKEINLIGLAPDVTSVLQVLLEDNPNPIVESLSLVETFVSNSLLRKLIKACVNMKNLCLMPKGRFLLDEVYPSKYEYNIARISSSYQYEFPLDDLEIYCRELQTLEMSHCKMMFSNSKDHYEFSRMNSLDLHFCDFHGMDLSVILKNSTDIEHLSLNTCENIALSDTPTMQSDKLEYLRIKNSFFGNPSRFVEDAVWKSRRTLKDIRLCGLRCDVTSVLKSYLDGNPEPAVESLWLIDTVVRNSLMVTLVEECKSLTYMCFMPYGLENPCVLHFKGRKRLESVHNIRSSRNRQIYD